jgi:hypothetical protein
MRYFMVGNVGCDQPCPGEGTLIRQRRTLWGARQWSYLYGQDADGSLRIWWGPWQNWNMVESGKYPSTREVSEAVALYMIDELGKLLGVAS